MAPYRFRLEAVRRVRQARRDELRGRLADAFLAAEKLEVQRQELLDEADGVREAQRLALAEGRLDVNRRLEAQRYELLLRSQVGELDEKQNLLEEEIERRREAVVAAEREVKLLDVLEEKGREEHQVEQNRAENKVLDEVASVRWAAVATGIGGKSGRA